MLVLAALVVAVMRTVGLLPGSTLVPAKNPVSTNLNSNIDVVASRRSSRGVATNTCMNRPKWNRVPSTRPGMRDPCIVDMIGNSNSNIVRVESYRALDSYPNCMMEGNVSPKSSRDVSSNESRTETGSSDPDDANENPTASPVESSSVNRPESPDPSVSSIDNYIGSRIANANLHMSSAVSDPHPGNIRISERPKKAPMKTTTPNKCAVEARSSRTLVGALAPNNVDLQIGRTIPSLYLIPSSVQLLALPMATATRDASPPTSHVSFRVSG